MPRKPTAERLGLSYVYVERTAKGDESFINCACRGSACDTVMKMRLNELLYKAHRGKYSGLCPSCAKKK
jgi:hypothetical protein